MKTLADIRAAMDRGPTIFTTNMTPPKLHHTPTEQARYAQFYRFQEWQDATTMNLIFGDNYVTVPPVPTGYEVYAKQWYDNQLKAVK